MSPQTTNQPTAIARTAGAENLAGGTITLGAADDLVATATAVLAAGSPGVPPHRHRTSSEAFVVLSGRFVALLGDEILTLEAGDSFVASPGVVHALAPAPGCHAEVLAVTTPPARRPDYYRLLDALHRGEASPQELSAGQEHFDSFFVDCPEWANRCA